MFLLFQGAVFRLHASFLGCTYPICPGKCNATTKLQVLFELVCGHIHFWKANSSAKMTGPEDNYFFGNGLDVLAGVWKKVKHILPNGGLRVTMLQSVKN